ncbi:MAG TPA: TIGR03118 family protein, partial [Rhodopila sp.]|nr:TIGR03118 family protein [Rhodopila sp.]
QSFGKFAGDLLVGNFGDGTINAFNLKNDHFMGQLAGTDGNPIAIGDLWALTPGNGANGGDPNTIYFTAGVKDEAQGLFGSLTPDPTGAHSMSG